MFHSTDHSKKAESTGAKTPLFQKFMGMIFTYKYRPKTCLCRRRVGWEVKLQPLRNPRWNNVGGQHQSAPTSHPGKIRYLFYRRLGGPRGRFGRHGKSRPPPGYDPRTVQPVASRCANYVKPGRVGNVLVKSVHQYGLHCSFAWNKF
jgi:hypothetical protein